MKTYFKYATFVSTLLGLVLSLNLIMPVQAVSWAKPPTKTPTPSGGPTATPTSSGAPAAYYVDCSAATNGNGTQASPWNSLVSPNARTFIPGDSLLFKRGMTCNGAFFAKGSGNASAPITLADYGTGALPVINGGTTYTSTVYLNEVEYYDIRNLAIRGSTTWALGITTNTLNRALHHFYLTNLDLTGVNVVATTRYDNGLLGVWANADGATINDVLVDGVTAHDTTAGGGISVGGGLDWPCGACGSNFTVRNSVAHDIYGDGIVVYQNRDVLIENNVAYNTGECPVGACTGSTPVGIWTWSSTNVLAQFNESYSNAEWSEGGFDIDGDNVNNTYQYNYAHSNKGYCAAIYDFSGFGGAGVNTVNPTFRYNLCIHNIQYALSTGEIRVVTWQGGGIDALQIYNNTFYFNPAPIALDGDSAALKMGGTFSANTFFKNNIVYSTYNRIFRADNGMAFDYNLYYTTSGQYEFKLGAATQPYTSMSAWQAACGCDAHSMAGLDPKLNGLGYQGVGFPTLATGYYTLQTTSPALNAGTNVCVPSCNGGSMGTRDFYGIALDATHNIGAYEGNGQ